MAVTSDVLRRKAEGLEMQLFLQPDKEVASPNETVPYYSYLEVRRMTVFIHSVLICLTMYLMHAIY